ncbi:MAG TPA: hypothetical protein VLG12_07140 [Candidatus Saccharimonadales bacterium]|nr:hypothetical protein [Candidatus Saccharimonadales bacterium]
MPQTINDYAFLNNIPSINKSFACISGNPIISAIISSYFNAPNEYFCVLEAPRMQRPDYENECYRKYNTLIRLGAEKIILAGLEEKTIEIFQNSPYAKNLIIIPSITDIEITLNRYLTKPNPSDIFLCKSTDIAKGLLFAKYTNKKLQINESAEQLDGNIFDTVTSIDHIVVLDDTNWIAPVIAANYAYSINARLQIFPLTSPDDVDVSFEEINMTYQHNGTQRGDLARESIDHRLTKYKSYLPNDYENIKFITFITIGIPYGYIFNDKPTTHLISYPDLSVQIVSNIIFSTKIKYTRNALLIDTGEIVPSETEIVETELGNMNIYIKTIKDEYAKNFTFNKYLEEYPYDLFYFCGHTAYLTAKRFRVVFSDNDGNDHTIIFLLVTTGAPTYEGKGKDATIRLQQRIEPLEIDSVDWKDEEGKERINVKENIKYFYSLEPEQWNIIDTEEDIPTKTRGLKFRDGIFQAAMHSIAGLETPIIFLNACVSLDYFNSVFVFAGARAYIGTVIEIPDLIAQKIAGQFFSNLSETKPLPLLLWEIQKDNISNTSERAYIHIGTHFTNILSPINDVKSDLIRRVKNNLSRKQKRLEKLDENNYSDVLRETRLDIEMLEKEVTLLENSE